MPSLQLLTQLAIRETIERQGEGLAETGFFKFQRLGDFFTTKLEGLQGFTIQKQFLFQIFFWSETYKVVRAVFNFWPVFLFLTGVT